MLDILKTLNRMKNFELYGKEWLYEDYRRRKIGRINPEENGGYGVSTTEITDIPGWEFETAILNAEHVAPVERYHDMESAIEGHNKWVEKTRIMADGAEIIKIGDGDIIDDEKVKLKKVKYK